MDYGKARPLATGLPHRATYSALQRRRVVVDLISVDFQLEKIRVLPPVSYLMEPLIFPLRGANGAIEAFRVSNLNGTLETSSRLAVRMSSVLEEADSVAGHVTTSTFSKELSSCNVMRKA
jgi:hypothetical protein